MKTNTEDAQMPPLSLSPMQNEAKRKKPLIGLNVKS